MKVYWRCTALLLFACAVWRPCQAKNVAVVVPKSNNSGNISSSELAKFFASSSQKWADGRNVVLVLPGGMSSEDAELVVQRIFKLDQTGARKFLATHKGSFITVSSEPDVLNKVESIPGAIGVVDVYSITSTINVLKVDGKLPLEQGYLLR
jgi:ABC-type phosphate transport system substrate-binding protein